MDATELESMELRVAFAKRVDEVFREMKDPRVVGRCKHLLLDVLVITILAVMCGADDWPEIEAFAERRQSWLKGFLALPHGAPSHDTFQRVFEALNRNEFAKCLFELTRALQEATGDKHIAIDGKALRASGRKSTGIANLHLVTAWATEHGLTLGQVACEDKSNEITAIPQLLRLLTLKDCTVTIDAMGCQTAIAEQIREQKADYVLGLKGNQSGLLEDMEQLVEAAFDADFAGYTKTQVTSKDQGHGREVNRSVTAIEIPADHPQHARWKDLRSVVVISTERIIAGESNWETRYYITSHAPQARKLGDAIRRHWSIENSQHWVLDVAFAEDRRRQSARNGATNLAAVRRLTNSILRQEKTNKRGIKNKGVTGDPP